MTTGKRLALAWTLAIAPAAWAQLPPATVPSLDQLRRPGDLPLFVPDPGPPPKAPALTTPPPSPEAPSLSQGARVLARGFRFRGNTVMLDAELQSIAAPFVDRALDNADLDDLRLRITRHYVDAGYINSGAVIPDQDATGGIITFDIIEGRLSEIAVGGNNRFRSGYIADRLALGAGPVLNVNRLQERMQLMLQDPQIERISAELAPGTERGEAVLRADVTGTSPFFGGLRLSNERSPAVGADQAELLFGTRNMLGHGETLTLQAATTSGLDDYSAGFTVPVSARGTLVQARYQRTHSRIVEAPFDALDIAARSHSWELGLVHPLIAHPQRSLAASALVANRSTRSFFLDRPSPFIPGAPDGRTKVSALRLGLDWVDRATERVFAARGLLSFGLDAFGATVGGGFPDSRFTALLAQAQWVQQVSSGAGLWVLRAEAQFADSALLGSEKYSLGGIDSVRGYRKDLLVRDSGKFGSIEYRHTIARVPVRANADSSEGAIRIAVFADAGQARDKNGVNPGPSYIAAVGPGLRWEPAAGFDVQLYYGAALKNVPTPTRTSQDRGWHLRAAFTKAF